MCCGFKIFERDTVYGAKPGGLTRASPRYQIIEGLVFVK